jgi:hypothetical protein
MQHAIARIKGRIRSNSPGMIFGSLAGLGIIFVGTLFILQGKAATNVTSVEAESGTKSARAVAVTTSGASGGSAVKFTQAPAAPTGEVFTMISIGDIQQEMWSASANVKCTNRSSYIVQNKTAWNLKYVWQVGDLQDWDDATHSHYERASPCMRTIENAGIPISLVVGNHDTNAVCYGGSACPGADTTVEVRNTTTWNTYYPPSRFPGIVTYQPGKTDNAYRTFQAGGLDWLILNYELWPRTDVVNWMKTVVASHPHHNVILISHSIMDGGGNVYNSNGGYGANSATYVDTQVTKAYANVRFTFSGHVGNSDFRQDTGVNGNKVYQFMDCYHDQVNNWMRILTFDTINNTVKTKVYAPLTDQTRTEAQANVNLSGISWVR